MHDHVAKPQRLMLDICFSVVSIHSHDTSLFPGLVLGWIEADFCNQGLILQHFSRSTRESSSHEQILQNFAKFWQIFRKFFKILKNSEINFFANFAKFLPNFLQKFCKICWREDDILVDLEKC